MDHVAILAELMLVEREKELGRWDLKSRKEHAAIARQRSVGLGYQMYFENRRLEVLNGQSTSLLPLLTLEHILAAATLAFGPGITAETPSLRWHPNRCSLQQAIHQVMETSGKKGRLFYMTHGAKTRIFYGMCTHRDRYIQEHLERQNGVYRFSAPELLVR